MPGQIKLGVGSSEGTEFISTTLKDGDEWVQVHENFMARRVNVEDGYAELVLELMPSSGLDTDTEYYVNASIIALTGEGTSYFDG